VARHGRGKTARRWEEESSLARALRALRSLQDQDVAPQARPPVTPAAFAVIPGPRQSERKPVPGASRASTGQKHDKNPPYAFQGYEGDIVGPAE
jgi:hypothetical protein